ncbi:hypothetical protein SBFV2_gp44 [Sulfolobales Beppu filamentous virus 2]|uniref:Uncharacterized protein n=1 Tax=Sulfolobales Beppu filamentous virus 2 TaxID=2493123 RepID=A0A3Q8Q3S4_9VIRU|nr:hypothetical protein HOU84_gp44 [Sulfolobales Beppu filamentous virus 2]AZI75811.1 hypothetical protein SBFV2_gp44 [Sulfolobales Beppu filamentous virus 2]
MSPLLCTRELNKYLESMIRDVKAIREKGYKAVYLIFAVNDFLADIMTWNKFRDEKVDFYTPLKESWDTFCENLEGFDYHEPLCYERFDPGTRLDEECIVQSQDQLLRDLLQ